MKKEEVSVAIAEFHRVVWDGLEVNERDVVVD